MNYKLTYENLEYPDFDGFLPDSQPLCEELDLSKAFDVLAQHSAVMWLEDGAIDYETDASYTVQPEIEID